MCKEQSSWNKKEYVLVKGEGLKGPEVVMVSQVLFDNNYLQ